MFIVFTKIMFKLFFVQDWDFYLLPPYYYLLKMFYQINKCISQN